MDNNKFYSEKLPVFSEPITNKWLKETLGQLSKILDEPKLKMYKWGEGGVAISIKLHIVLPPLGNYMGIDIQKNEQILLVFKIETYPISAPRIYSDRLDFPKDKLAHLYIAKEGNPSALCLVRGEINEWYTTKTIKDLLIRVENWYRDAATGQLVEDGNQYEPVRLEGYRGYAIYEHEKLSNIVKDKASSFEDENFIISLFKNKAGVNEFPTFELIKVFTKDELAETKENLNSAVAEIIDGSNIHKHHLGYIVWSNEAVVFSDYEVNLPKNWNGFREFCSMHGVDIRNLESLLVTLDFNFSEIPIIIGVKRPKEIIGFSSEIEFFNFYINPKSEERDKLRKKLNDLISVSFQAHNEPLTIEKAHLISGTDHNNKSSGAIIGCGALGSKIALHFIRSGKVELVLIDNDTIAPHNLVRHGLLPKHIGMNKAFALKEVAKEMYPANELPIVALSEQGNYLLENCKDGLNHLDWIFDFTASESFFNELILQGESLNKNILFRGLISDFGSLGLLFMEGSHRNPRLDDLQIFLYSLALKIDWISEWLIREFNTNKKEILCRVGVGCNSETTILSDDIISIHAGYFSRSINHELSKKQNNRKKAKIFLNRTFYKEGFQMETHCYEVPKFKVINAVNDKSWQIRINGTVADKLNAELSDAFPNETGGVLIGSVNTKTKIVYVTNYLSAPTDSKSSPNRFYRGIFELPEQIDAINNKTGGQLGYIGEWHTHPLGPEEISEIDLETVAKFKTDYVECSISLPVFLIILTTESFLPYVF